VHLARFAASVTLVVRGGELAMSDYLVRQLERSEVRIRYRCEVVEVEGGGRLEWVTLADRPTGAPERVPAGALFVLIGAGPLTGWLEKVVQRDAGGHVLTGSSVARGEAGPLAWPLERAPHPLETSLPGVFACGDVRHRSPRGVAAAVADGAIAIRSVFEYFEGE
jgi:thioredoxin reductase (NADPH)